MVGLVVGLYDGCFTIRMVARFFGSACTQRPLVQIQSHRYEGIAPTIMVGAFFFASERSSSQHSPNIFLRIIYESTQLCASLKKVLKSSFILIYLKALYFTRSYSTKYTIIHFLFSSANFDLSRSLQNLN